MRQASNHPSGAPSGMYLPQTTPQTSIEAGNFHSTGVNLLSGSNAHAMHHVMNHQNPYPVHESMNAHHLHGDINSHSASPINFSRPTSGAAVPSGGSLTPTPHLKNNAGASIFNHHQQQASMTIDYSSRPATPSYTQQPAVVSSSSARNHNGNNISNSLTKGHHSSQQQQHNLLGNNISSAFSTSGANIATSSSTPTNNNNSTTLNSPSTLETLAKGDSFMGNVIALAHDQGGCRALQKRLEERDPVVIAGVFAEMKNTLTTLMVDPFGNYLCQKLLEVADEKTITEIAVLTTPKLSIIALDSHGTRAAQRLVEAVAENETNRGIIIGALKGSVVTLVQNLHGNHVVQKCLHSFPVEACHFIFDAVCKHCLDVSMHRHGCCVLQRCIDTARGAERNKIIEEVERNSYTLVQDPFGNYVVQYILKVRNTEEPIEAQSTPANFNDSSPSNSKSKPNCSNNRSLNSTTDYNKKIVHGVVSRLLGHIEELSRQKFASNVVEECLCRASSADRDAIVRELINASAESMKFMLSDPFGNYVIQRALSVSESPLLQDLTAAVGKHLGYLRISPSGKRICTKLLKKFPNLANGDVNTITSAITTNAGANTNNNNNNNSNVNNNNRNNTKKENTNTVSSNNYSNKNKDNNNSNNNNNNQNSISNSANSNIHNNQKNNPLNNHLPTAANSTNISNEASSILPHQQQQQPLYQPYIPFSLSPPPSTGNPTFFQNDFSHSAHFTPVGQMAPSGLPIPPRFSSSIFAFADSAPPPPHHHAPLASVYPPQAPTASSALHLPPAPPQQQQPSHSPAAAMLASNISRLAHMPPPPPPPSSAQLGTNSHQFAPSSNQLQHQLSFSYSPMISPLDLIPFLPSPPILPSTDPSSSLTHSSATANKVQKPSGNNNNTNTTNNANNSNQQTTSNINSLALPPGFSPLPFLASLNTHIASLLGTPSLGPTSPSRLPLQQWAPAPPLMGLPPSAAFTLPSALLPPTVAGADESAVAGAVGDAIMQQQHRHFQLHPQQSQNNGHHPLLWNDWRMSTSNHSAAMLPGILSSLGITPDFNNAIGANINVITNEAANSDGASGPSTDPLNLGAARNEDDIK